MLNKLINETIKFYEKMNYKNTGELLLDKTINKE